MSEFQVLSEQERKELRQSFAEEATAQEFLEKLEANTDDAVSLRDLYCYAHGDVEDFDIINIEKALASNPGMRNALRRMVTEATPYHSGEARAAGEAGPIPRFGNGFSIRYQASRTASDNIYIIIELIGEIPELKHILYIFDEADTCKSFPLSPPRNGIIQVLVSRDDPLLEMLSDPKTEVMLR
jgi:hypothetical protein